MLPPPARPVDLGHARRQGEQGGHVAPGERQGHDFRRAERLLLGRRHGFDERCAHGHRHGLGQLANLDREGLPNGLSGAQLETLIRIGLEALELDLQRIAPARKRRERELAVAVGDDIAGEGGPLVHDSDEGAGHDGHARITDDAIHRCGCDLGVKDSGSEYEQGSHRCDEQGAKCAHADLPSGNVAELVGQLYTRYAR